MAIFKLFPSTTCFPGGITVHRAAKNWTPLKQLSIHTSTTSIFSWNFREKDYVSMCLFPPPSPVASCAVLSRVSCVQFFATLWTIALPGSTLWRGLSKLWASQVAVVVKNPPANAGDVGDTDSIPGPGRSPGEGHGNPLQYSCLKNPHE